ncbi:hypothetical protein [Hymenobacter sp. BT491]|uniref:hypothetical protein n=1 Tax=Hymenobacter sp. BT491 TaxID=2766779 RepID=UPI001653C9B5|nr:hypothetical protein [Hymenobacter sp. BT491]MBC6991953.1 hypothetical protein [Hymenobacter sp. BT491]
MKPVTSLCLILLLLWLPSCQAWAQVPVYKEQITKEFALTSDAGHSTLVLYNIFGNVTVQGYSGNKVVVEVTKTITAKDAATLEQGKKEAQVGFEQRNDTVVVYNQGPHDSRPNRGRRNNDWDNRRIEYEYTFDFTVKVPAQMKVHVSTVNNGKVVIQDVTGALQAYNVNGAIAIKNAKGATTARTVNGNVDASYLSSPAGNSSYNTINGQITVVCPKDLSADLHFKSFHGELFTDFPKAEILPAQVTQNKQQEGAGTKYKLTKDTAVRLGKGGTNLRFETLNGDVTVKQQP